MDTQSQVLQSIREVPTRMVKNRDYNILCELRSAIESKKYNKIVIVYGASHYTHHQERALLEMKRYYKN